MAAQPGLVNTEDLAVPARGSRGFGRRLRRRNGGHVLTHALGGAPRTLRPRLLHHRESGCAEAGGSPAVATMVTREGAAAQPDIPATAGLRPPAAEMS
jgi:hypothetical protein